MKYLKFSIFALLLLAFWSCSKEAGSLATPASNTGVGGSYATFMIVGDFLYTITDSDINTLSLEDPANPKLINTQEIGERIESIFNLDKRLFIGSGSGLYIYTIQEDGIPQFTSSFSYDQFPIRPCDPVVANDSFAFVTLNTVNGSCWGEEVHLNQLSIFDITDVANPVLINSYPLSGPKGVGLDGNTVFVCDNEEGLKIFDVTNKYDIKLIKQFGGYNAYDVIPFNGLLLVVGPENLYQYDYSNLNNIHQVSKIAIKP